MSGVYTKKLIGLSGKKSAGKDTSIAIAKRVYKDLFNKNPDRVCINTRFADTLKRFCVDTLGIPEKLVFGGEADKNQPTKYLWEHQPLWVRWKYHPDRDKHLAELKLQHGQVFEPELALTDESYFYQFVFNQGMFTPRILSGQMTVRQVLQVLGTDYFRRFYPDFHVDALANQVERLFSEGAELITISDVRFPNEVWKIVDSGGYVIRLLRSPYKDEHESETALDNFPFATVQRCIVVDNRKLTLREQDQRLTEIFTRILLEK